VKRQRIAVRARCKAVALLVAATSDMPLPFAQPGARRSARRRVKMRQRTKAQDTSSSPRIQCQALYAERLRLPGVPASR